MKNTINVRGVEKNSPSAMGVSLGSTVMADDAPMLAVTRPAGCVAPGTLACGEDWMVFGQVEYGNAGLESLGGNPGLETNTYGTSLGLEYVVNSCLNVGVGWSHTWSENDLSGGGSAHDVRGIQVETDQQGNGCLGHRHLECPHEGEKRLDGRVPPHERGDARQRLLAIDGVEPLHDHGEPAGRMKDHFFDADRRRF